MDPGGDLSIKAVVSEYFCSVLLPQVPTVFLECTVCLGQKQVWRLLYQLSNVVVHYPDLFDEVDVLRLCVPMFGASQDSAIVSCRLIRTISS